jgi:RNA polymerase sigma-70 factor (ECF subfamily)
VQDADVAHDVLQDSLYIVCRRIGTVQDPRAIRAWAFRIATREAVRTAKRNRRHEANHVDALDELPADVGDDCALDDELLTELQQKLEALPKAAQISLRLRYLQGFTQPEIAAVLEIPLGTVKSRIAYGLAALRTMLQR